MKVIEERTERNKQFLKELTKDQENQADQSFQDCKVFEYEDLDKSSQGSLKTELNIWDNQSVANDSKNSMLSIKTP